MDLEYKIKSVEAEQYALQHPAIELSRDTLGGESISIIRYVTCINGVGDYAGPKEHVVYSDDEDYDKWRESEYFDADDVIPGIEEKPPIDVPYEVYYGYEWKPAKVAYCADISWTLYSGEKYEWINYDPKNYCRFHGEDLGPFDTYEETWIAVAEWIRKNLGDWGREDLTTEKEKSNHEETSPFNFIDSDKPGFREMKRNDEWIRITDEIMNNRWFSKFVHTEYFMNNWKSTFESNQYGFPYRDIYDRIMKKCEDFDSMRVEKKERGE